MQKITFLLLALWLFFLIGCASNIPSKGDKSAESEISSSKTSPDIATSTKDVSTTNTKDAPPPPPPPPPPPATYVTVVDERLDESAPSEKYSASEPERSEFSRDAKKSKSAAKLESNAKSEDLPQTPKSGKMTAGEWNDLNNWDFWQKLMTNEEYANYAKNWNFADLQPIICVTQNGKSSAINTTLELRYQGKTIAKAMSDNKGRATLWIKPEIAAADCQLFANGIAQNIALKTKDINEINTNSNKESNLVQIAFVVDATGSMQDELSFLQTELLDVIGRSKASSKAGLNIATSSVFYRDKGDAYITRVSDFNPNANETVNFIKKQSAGGGGDFPEAVHSALEDATQKLVWSPQARTRILFLILDAPPHTNEATKKSLEKSIATAQAQGIKIIPIVASGINKETEFLMRHYANATNGTYVFITDHSGIGGAHLEPTVGKHDIEFLANLMVRLIQQYSM